MVRFNSTLSDLETFHFNTDFPTSRIVKKVEKVKTKILIFQS